MALSLVTNSTKANISSLPKENVSLANHHGNFSNTLTDITSVAYRAGHCIFAEKRKRKKPSLFEEAKRKAEEAVEKKKEKGCIPCGTFSHLFWFPDGYSRRVC